jgi:hypothetical protein
MAMPGRMVLLLLFPGIKAAMHLSDTGVSLFPWARFRSQLPAPSPTARTGVTC